MAELRFILFIAGLVFLVVLAAWELRRPRQAASGDPRLRRSPGTRQEPELGAFGEHAAEPPAAPRVRSPLSPPRVDIAALEEASDASTGDSDPGRHVAAAHAEPAVRTERASIEHALIEGIEPVIGLAQDEPARPAGDSPYGVEARPDLAVAAAASEIVVPASDVPTRSIFVDWPPEQERHIVSVRVVSGSGERLSGRAVRLAMTACGFVHGPFGIYHLPDQSGRAQISAASLSKPGVLDPVTLDFQRLLGLSLFTVLPGTLPPATALDQLIETARELSQRLGARLQDDRGRPLDGDRLEDLRDRVQSLASSGFRAEPAA